MQNRLLYILPILVFLVLAVYFAIGLTKDPKILPSALIDKPVPDFALKPLDNGTKEGYGNGFASGDLKQGGVSVLNVFASWCIPCRAEHPFITQLAEMKIAPVYGLNYKNKPADALGWLRELGDPYAAIGADVSGRVGIDWGVYGVPETFIVDGQGKIRYKHVGPINQKALDDKILPVIRKLGQ